MANGYIRYASKRMQQTCHSGTCVAFLPPKVLHYDGRAAVRRLVKHRNPWIVAPFAVKMRRIRQIAAHSAKSVAISYPDASCTNHKSVARFLIKERHTNFANCILFDVYRTCIYTYVPTSTTCVVCLQWKRTKMAMVE